MEKSHGQISFTKGVDVFTYIIRTITITFSFTFKFSLPKNLVHLFWFGSVELVNTQLDQTQSKPNNIVQRRQQQQTEKNGNKLCQH